MKENNIVKLHHGYIIRDRDIELAKHKFFTDRLLSHHISWLVTQFKRYKTGKQWVGGPDIDRRQSRKSLYDALSTLEKNRYKEKEIMEEAFQDLFLSLDNEHCGDCVQIACTCDRCWIEDLIGCQTNPDNSPYKPEIALCEYTNE